MPDTRLENPAQPGLVSVVLASYNMGHYLPIAVRSVLAQTYLSVEAIVIDDGSKDNTREVVKQFGDEPRVRCIHQPNGGQAKAKNTGILNSRGEYIAFLDADDEWLPNKIEQQLPLFANPQVGVVYSRGYLMGPEGEYLGTRDMTMYRGRISEQLLIDNFVNFPSTVVRRECFEKFGCFDESLPMGIDYDLWLRFSAHYEFDYLEQPLIRYRVWGGQMSHNHKKRYECGIRIMQRFVEQHPHAVSPESVSMGWAHTYVGRGDVTLWKDNDWSGAYRDYLRALRYRPGYRRAWRAMLRGVVSRHPPRNPSELRSDLSKNENLTRKLGRKLTETLIPALPRVMMYHRFSREPQFRRIDSKVFREQVIYLQNNFDLVPFSTLVQAFQEQQFGRSRLAAITIDDAYHDVWDIAYPILHELGAPAIVYVPTDFVDRGAWLWPDLLDYILRATRSPWGTLSLEGADELRRPLGGEAQMQSSWNDFADHLFAAAPERREKALNQLAKSLNVEVPANPTNRYLPLTWAQLKSMHATGIEIGSHTCSHPRLSQHTASQQFEELRRSKTVIEQRLGVVAEHFCYPYGAADDISDQSPTIALQAGYRSAVVSYHDGQRFSDPFQIRRISAPASGLTQLERATNSWRLVLRGARDKLYFR